MLAPCLIASAGMSHRASLANKSRYVTLIGFGGLLPGHPTRESAVGLLIATIVSFKLWRHDNDDIQSKRTSLQRIARTCPNRSVVKHANKALRRP